MNIDWGKILTAAAPLVAGIVGPKLTQGKSSPGLDAMSPQIMALIQQMQQQSGQSYQMQTDRYNRAQPLTDSISRMANGLLPTMYQSPMGGGAPAATPSGPAPLPMAGIEDLMAGYDRRGGGTGGAGRGLMGGASMGATAGSILPGIGTLAGAGIGGAIGGLKGMFSNRADSAPSDFELADAQDAIRNAYRMYLGREASEAEVMDQIRGQGWEPGDRYVGQSGLTSVLRAIQQARTSTGRG
jgi:hypothetical protein